MAALDRPYWNEARFERREGWDDDAYPFNLPVLKGLYSVVFHPAVTFLVGENGSGKSTLIEALAVAWGFNPEGGNRNFSFSTRISHSPLHEFVRPIRSVRRPREGFFPRADGESFMALMDHKLHGNGLYILDEPEAALSPSRQMSFLTRLHHLVNAGSQFIITTHSPILLGYPNAWIYQVSEHGLDRIAYEDTDHFQVTRNFLTRRDRMLEILLEE